MNDAPQVAELWKSYSDEPLIPEVYYHFYFIFSKVYNIAKIGFRGSTTETLIDAPQIAELWKSYSDELLIPEVNYHLLFIFSKVYILEKSASGTE